MNRSAPSNFDPFIDFEAVTPEMASGLHKALREHRAASDDFVADDEPDLRKAARVLELAHGFNEQLNDIMEALHTTPVMVHVAGEQREETHPSDPDVRGIIQRCTRCGSVLHFWAENMAYLDPETGPRDLEIEDIPWWPENAIVAKATGPVGIGMYSIEDGRELAKHEYPCVDLSALEE